MVTALVVVLGVLLCLALGVIAALAKELMSQRQLVEGLRESLETDPGTPRGPRATHAVQKEGDFFGRNVAMAARVASMADGDEILVSSDIADRLADSTRFVFTEEETVEFKGLPGEHRLWSVEAA